LLESSPYLLGNDPGIADIGVMPFIRQSAHIDSDVFGQLPYPNLQRWLQHWLEHPLFLQTMIKLPVWQEGDDVVVFPSQPCAIYNRTTGQTWLGRFPTDLLGVGRWLAVRRIRIFRSMDQQAGGHAPTPLSAGLTGQYTFTTTAFAVVCAGRFCSPSGDALKHQIDA
jgi:hypothetical protein